MSGHYKPTFSTDAKRAMRAIVYERAAAVILPAYRNGVRGDVPDVLMVAGRAPAAEIICARASLPGCRVTSVDTDAVAISAARMAGADRAVTMDLSDDRLNDREHLEYRLRYDFVNLDLCAKLTPKTGSVIAAAAKRTGSVLAVWIVYGLDHAKDHERLLSKWREQPSSLWWVQSRTVTLIDSAERAGWTGANLGRLLWVCSAIRTFGAWNSTYGDHLVPFACGRYFGHHMPLMVVMFENQQWTEKPIDVFNVTDGDLRVLATQRMMAFGAADAGARFDLDVARLAAMKAVHTRGTALTDNRRAAS